MRIRARALLKQVRQEYDTSYLVPALVCASLEAIHEGFPVEAQVYATLAGAVNTSRIVTVDD